MLGKCRALGRAGRRDQDRRGARQPDDLHPAHRRRHRGHPRARPGRTTTPATGAARSASSCSSSSASRIADELFLTPRVHLARHAAARSRSCSATSASCRTSRSGPRATTGRSSSTSRSTTRATRRGDDLARLDQFRSRGESTRDAVLGAGLLQPRAARGPRHAGDPGAHPDRRALQRATRRTCRRWTRRRRARCSRTSGASSSSACARPRRRPTAWPRRRPGRSTPRTSWRSSFQSLDGRLPAPAAGGGEPQGGASASCSTRCWPTSIPAHPEFGAEVRPAALRRVLPGGAAGRPGARTGASWSSGSSARCCGRSPIRSRLGEMHEEAFILGRLLAPPLPQEGGRGRAARSPWPSCARGRTSRSRPGLTKEVQNLVILVFAEQTNRSFFLHGGPAQEALDNLPDELELREQTLPAPADWEEAGAPGGDDPGRARRRRIATATSVRAARDRRQARGGRAPRGLRRRSVRVWRARAPELGVDPGASRLRTARAAERFVEAIHAATLDDVVSAIGRASVETTAEAMGTSIKKAAALVAALDRANFELFDAIRRLPDDPAGAGGRHPRARARGVREGRAGAGAGSGAEQGRVRRAAPARASSAATSCPAAWRQVARQEAGNREASRVSTPTPRMRSSVSW